MKRKNLGKITSLVLAFLLCMALVTSAVFANNENLLKNDSTGNTFATSADTDTTVPSAKKDLYWVGKRYSATNMKVGYDFIAAGETININMGTVNGALRAAGKTVFVSGVKIGHNSTIAGQEVIINNSNVDTGMYAAGSVSIDGGSSEALHVTGEKVYINQTVYGDINVDATELTIGKNAVINGTISGEIAEEPVIEKGAKISTNTLQIKPEKKKESSSSSSSSVSGYIFTLLSLAVLWLVVKLGGFKLVEDASEMASERSGHVGIVGFATLFLAPIAMIIALCTVIGIPLAFMVLMLYIALCIISKAFAGSVLGLFIAQKKEPDMNPWLSTGLGVLLVWIASKLPFLGFFVTLASLIFTMGYFMIMVWGKIKNNKNDDFNGTSPVPVIESGIEERE